MVEQSPHEVKMTREEFEELAQGYIRHLPTLIQGALSLAGIRPTDVDAVILTGGHSRWYWVENAVKSTFPHVSVENKTLLRHRHPDQSVARGLAYRWMIDAVGGRPRPRRRATHAIWIASPETTAQMVAAPPLNLGPVAHMAAGTPEDPLLVMDRGQVLPFHTSAPAKLSVQKIDFDAGQATLRLKLYTGSSEDSRQELADRVAAFDRPFWESFVKRVTNRLPWSTSFDTDEFDVEVLCSVDENELFTGKVTITRYHRGRPAQQQVQMLQTTAGP
jgi:molecular chaperone DnaK (HSP70)